MSSDSEYVCLWKVRYACAPTQQARAPTQHACAPAQEAQGLPPKYCEDLVCSLAPIPGAVREYQGWKCVKGLPPPPSSLWEWPKPPPRAIDPKHLKDCRAPVLPEGGIFFELERKDDTPVYAWWPPPASHIVVRAKELFVALMLHSHLDGICRLALSGKESFQELWEEGVLKIPSIRENPAAKKLLQEIGEERIDEKRLQEILKKHRHNLHIDPERMAKETAFFIFDEQEIPAGYVPEVPPGGRLTFDVFGAIYFNSLRLKKTEVYKFCWANDIRPTRDVHGFILPKPQQEKQTEPAPNEEKADFVVPSKLWKGKTHSNAAENLRKAEEFPPEVIAHVLFFWCGLTNKTGLGKMLRCERGLVDSTYWSYADKLLKKAATLKIVQG